MSALSVAQTAPSCEEHELVTAVRRGDDRAFEELYARYRRTIAGYIFGMVGDHARAEDIAQEVFISALSRLRDTEDAIAFKPWIYAIAKNACIDEFRRTRRAREVPLVTVSTEDGSGEERDLPSTSPAPDAAVESKQSLSDLQDAFQSLSESHHKVIVMREFEGLSYSQIGERLGMTRPVVESTLFRARKRLSEEYDELVSGRRCRHVQAVIDQTDERAMRRLGIRQRRQLARHLAHCQPCRRHARMASLDESFFQAPSTLAGKIAALLPFPWLRGRRGGGGGGGGGSSSAGGAHPLGATRSLHSLARFAGTPSPSSIGGGRAAAALAAVALAGGGVATVVAAQGGHRAQTPRAVARLTSGPSATHGTAGGPANPAMNTAAASHRQTPAGAHARRSSGSSARARKALGATSSPSKRASQTSSRPASPASSGSGTATPLSAAQHAPSVPAAVNGVSNTVGTVVQKVTKPVASGVSKVTAGVLKKVASSQPSAPAITTPTVPNAPLPRLPQVPPLPKIPSILGH
jgi:RNA polymerase sigma factor (sigma-70 family)